MGTVQVVVWDRVLGARRPRSAQHAPNGAAPPGRPVGPRGPGHLSGGQIRPI